VSRATIIEAVNEQMIASVNEGLENGRLDIMAE